MYSNPIEMRLYRPEGPELLRPAPAAANREVIVMYATVEDLERQPWSARRSRDRRSQPAPAQRVHDNEDESWPLEHRPEAASAARAITRSVLQDWQVGQETAESAMLVVSELVTNSLEHARPPVALHLHQERMEHRVWVAITDGGPAESDGAWTTSCTPDEHGRGLNIVDALTTDHGTCAHAGGTMHWAQLPTEKAAV
ncbi:ATP-binding protein [Streptomyces sp. CA-251387]|uniref:ATP-binding protein n=1 Tax=Streptomyces sp. CA-251387 TaxID=3240064 RepID=UPI003D946F74